MSLNKKQYTTITLGDRSISIPIVNPSIQHTNNISTPEWMIQMDDLLSSTIENFEDFGELYGWYAEQARLTQGHTANQLISTSAVQHSNILVVLPVGIYIPSLENKMNSGANIASILIVRLMNVGDMKEKQQMVLFNDCKIESMQQQLDQTIISFRPTARTNIIFKYSQAGELEGQSVSFFDYTTGKNDSN